MNKHNDWEKLLEYCNNQFKDYGYQVKIWQDEDGYYACDICKDGKVIENYAENYFEDELSDLVNDVWHDLPEKIRKYRQAEEKAKSPKITGKGFYYIRTAVSEFHSAPVAFFETLEEAKEAMRYFADWYREKGTGCIYFQPTGVSIEDREYIPFGDHKPEVHKVAVVSPAQFICRGLGIDEKLDIVKFSDKEF